MRVRKATQPGGGLPGAVQQETWVWDGLALVQRGNKWYSNELHIVGGETLMSRSLNPEPAQPTQP